MDKEIKSTNRFQKGMRKWKNSYSYCPPPAKEVSENTIKRKQIHQLIKEGIKENLTDKQIMQKLKENPEYEQFENFFENWILDQIKKNANEKGWDCR